MDVYFITHWDKHYENNESRKRGKLSWVPFPNKHDGLGYRRMIKHEHGAALFGAFVVIVEVASQMPVRGVLANGCGPLTPEDIADKTGFTKELIAGTLEFCTTKNDWIGKKKWDGAAGNPDTSADNPDFFPKNPETSAKVPEAMGKNSPSENRREQKGIEGKKKAPAKKAAAGDDFFAQLKKDPDYEGIDIDEEFRKARLWIKERPGRVLTEKFFRRWLRNADRPVSGPPADKSSSGPPLREISERLWRNYGSEEPTREIARRIAKEYSIEQQIDFIRFAGEANLEWSISMEKFLDEIALAGDGGPIHWGTAA